MKDKKDYVWYASYGSNISRNRFLCYIQGGKPIGSQKEYAGCSDKSLPLDDEEIYINSELYFAKKSKTWNGGGVAFIKTAFDQKVNTFGRMYLITKEQFEEVVKQETNYSGKLSIDYELSIKNGNSVFRENSWYGNLIYLGQQRDFPIFTFTNESNLEKEINPPDKEYVKMIAIGIQEIYNLGENDLEEYFKSKIGITGETIENELKEILK